jgi:hypothetical protein
MGFDLPDKWTTLWVGYTGEHAVLQHYAMMSRRFT